MKIELEFHYFSAEMIVNIYNDETCVTLYHDCKCEDDVRRLRERFEILFGNENVSYMLID